MRTDGTRCSARDDAEPEFHLDGSFEAVEARHTHNHHGGGFGRRYREGTGQVKRIRQYDDPFTVKHVRSDVSVTRQWMGTREQDGIPMFCRRHLQLVELRRNLLGCHDADVDRGCGDFYDHLPLADSVKLNVERWMTLQQFAYCREDCMSAQFVAADPEDSPLALGLASNGSRSSFRELEEPGAFAEEHIARWRQGRVLGRAVKQSFPQLFFQSSDRLTDGGLGLVQFRRGSRETSLRSHGKKHLQFGQFHKIPCKSKRAITRLDDGP